MDHATLAKRLTEEFARLSPQLRRAARHVLDRPDDVALMSMRRLAGAAGVQPASMVRLAQAFGFESYVAFRQIFQNRLRVRPHNYVRRARDLQARGGDAPARLVDEMAAANEENLRETILRNGSAKFVQAARVLLAARRVYVVGARSAFLIAYYLEYAMRMFRDDVVLLGGSGGTFADGLRTLKAGDVVLAVGFDPYTFDTVRAVSYARDHGAVSVVLTDSPVSPLVKGAEHVLLIRNESPAVFNAVSTVLAAAEILVALMVREGGAGTLAAFRDTERQLHDFDTYWRAGGEGRVPAPKRAEGQTPKRRDEKGRSR